MNASDLNVYGDITLGDGSVSDPSITFDSGKALTLQWMEDQNSLNFVRPDVDIYPFFSFRPFSHDNMHLMWDAYYDGTFNKSSDAGSNMRMLKRNDTFNIEYDSGVAQGGTITWNDGLVLDLVSGSVGVNNTSPSLIDAYDASADKLLNVFSTAKARLVAQGATGATVDLFDGGGANDDRWFQLLVDGGVGAFNSLNDDGTANISNIMVMDLGDGNVGFGTATPSTISTYDASPDTIINVVDTGSIARLVAQGDLGASLDMVDSGGAADDKWLQFLVDAGIGKFRTVADDGLSVQTDNILVMDLGTGNVGFGVAAPSGALDVAGNSFYLGDGTTGDPFITFDSGNSLKMQWNEDQKVLTFLANDVYPDFGIRMFAHDGIQLSFDAWYDGANWVSGDAGTNAIMQKVSDKLTFRYDSGVAQGGTITWNDGLTMDLTNGNVGINTSTPDGALHVEGDCFFGDKEGNGDYSEFEADGTLEFVGAATVWKDINLGAALLSLPASSAPGTDEFVDEVGADTGIDTYAFAVGEMVSGTVEIQHDYKEGSDITPHIHWQGIAAPSGTDYVKWQLVYTVARSGETLDAVTTIVGEGAIDTQYEFHITNTAVISGPLLIGDQILFQLSRIAAAGDAYAGEALIATVGFHYEIDTVGSRTITTK